MSEPEDVLSKWNRRHADPGQQPRAVEVLSQNLHLLPVRGQALDLACGLGGNALLLARAGLEVTAWDFSPVAIDRLKGLAAAQGYSTLVAEVRDLALAPPPENKFDVIVVSYFLDRSLTSSLLASLRPGGLLFYQTYTRIAVTDQGPVNPEYRLGDNELLNLFEPLALRFYREENRLGSHAQGCRDVAMLVAEKI